MDNTNQKKHWTCVGVILGPHGITGGLKVKSFCENPRDITKYNPLRVEDYPEVLDFSVISDSNEILKVTVEKICNRSKAIAMKGKLLFAARNKLPKTNNEEYYFTDLIGLDVRNPSNHLFGTVKNAGNYGAGTFLEILNNQTLETIFVPFKKELIPVVNLDENYIIVKEQNNSF